MLQQKSGTSAARYIMDDMAHDVVERLSFLRHTPKNSLIIGEWTGTLAHILQQDGSTVTRCDPVPMNGEHPIIEDRPLPFSGFDLIACLGTLDTLNDLPGALIHLRRALAQGGLMIASFMGAGSLPILREAMLAADAERPAARLHPMVDVRAGGQLLQRTLFTNPVTDSRDLTVSFRSLQQLIADLRAQGLGNCLAEPAPPLTRSAVRRAEQVFLTHADDEGRVAEQFAILTLSGWQK